MCINDGSVDSVPMYKGRPVYEWPAALRLNAAMNGGEDKCDAQKRMLVCYPALFRDEEKFLQREL